MLSCSGCMSIFTSELPPPGAELDYDSYYSESNLSVPAFIEQRAAEIVAEFSPYKKCGRMLDIGFGAGTLLKAGQKAGWQPFGLEVSLPAVEQARSRGFETFHGSLEESAYPDSHFDVVMASEILEHLPDPLADLREIARIIRPGGLFWATTPSARGISYRFMKMGWSILSPPEHTQIYSAKGVERLFGGAGFSQVRIRTMGVNPHEIVNYLKNNPDTRPGFDRVNTGYDLNAKLMRSGFRRTVKRTFNWALNISGLGDSLKIYAEK